MSSLPGQPPAPQTLILVTSGAEETVAVGRLVGAACAPNDVIALSGPLGSGKTCFTQGLAQGLGIVEPVPSPTFNLMLVHPGHPTLYHVDLYRLDVAEQLDDIDFVGTLEADGVTVIEWADRFPAELPEERLDVALEVVGASERRITLTARGPRFGRLCAAVTDQKGASP